MTAPITLAKCPIGLFTCQGELCLKTEYGNNEGRIDAYIVSSGEFFWGAQPQSVANQRAQMVTPVDAARLAAIPTDRPIAGDGEGEKQVRAWIGILGKVSAEGIRLDKEAANQLAGLLTPRADQGSGETFADGVASDADRKAVKPIIAAAGGKCWDDTGAVEAVAVAHAAGRRAGLEEAAKVADQAAALHKEKTNNLHPRDAREHWTQFHCFAKAAAAIRALAQPTIGETRGDGGEGRLRAALKTLVSEEAVYLTGAEDDSYQMPIWTTAGTIRDARAALATSTGSGS